MTDCCRKIVIVETKGYTWCSPSQFYELDEVTFAGLADVLNKDARAVERKPIEKAKEHKE